MAKKPETGLQQRIRKALKKRFGGMWRKIWGGPFQDAGFPDLLGCVAGLYIALEVKMPGEEPSELQVETIEEIIEAGGIAGVVYGVDEAIAFVEEALARTGGRRGLRELEKRLGFIL